MRKKTIVLIARGDEKWIGGLYYIKNMCYQLALNEEVTEKYKILVMCSTEYVSEFIELKNKIGIKGIKNFDSRKTKITYVLYYFIKKTILFYPVPSLKFSVFMRKMGCESAWWIPDFQDSHFPENFSEKELSLRSLKYKIIAQNDLPLVLSSRDSLNDFQKFYSTKRENTYVVPFVSCIEDDVKDISDSNTYEILRKYGVQEKRYVVVSNQFWKHKNHVVLLKAIKLLSKNKKIGDLRFVFTGLPKDYRNPEYFNDLMELMEDEFVKPYINVLGFINRIDQLVIMKGAKYIIQPSLFEGWGTVVEDAKVLDKLILLSDIPIHREQMNDNCVLFKPYDPQDLAEKIIEMNSKNHIDNIEKGIKEMHVHAKQYSKEFMHLLEDVESRRKR